MEVYDDVAVMACPLNLEEDCVDALFASFPKSYATNEWLSLVTLAAESHQQAELVWEMRTHVRESARVERELEMARQIQEGLVPRALQFDGLLRGVEVAIGFEPCRWVGGDYVDAVGLQDGRVLLAVADVCGKGMQAAIVASAVHTAIHVIAAYTTSIRELLERINLHLCNYLPSHSFVTMICAALDLTTGNLEYASSGHPPAMVVQPGGPVDLLHYGDNPPLGMMDTPVLARTTTLAVGETLLLYTDGLTELVNEQRQPLGMGQLAEILSDVLARNPQATARETQVELIAALHAYRGNNPATDDATFLVARRCGATQPARY
jgi:serine phosphatase RsbU (regulator of sigma subunit)